MPLARKILLVNCALLLITAIVITLISLKKMQDHIHDGIITSNLSYSQSQADKLANWLQFKRNTVSSIVSSIEGNSEHEEILRYLQQGKRSAEFDLTYFGLEDGNMYRSSGYNTVSGYDPRKRGWYKQAKDTIGVIETNPFVAASTGKLTVTVAQSLKKGGNLIGVVGASLGLDSINEDILNMKVPGEGFAFLISDDGTIISHPNSDFNNKPIADIKTTLTLEQLISGNSSLLTADFRDETYLVSRVPVPDTNWYLVLAGSEKVLMQPLNSLFSYIVIASAIILIASIIIATPITKMLLANLVKVSSALQEISAGGGDLTKRISNNTQDEVGTLALNFNSFVDHLLEILHKVEEVAQSLTDQSATASNMSFSQSQKARLQQEEVTQVATSVTEMTAATQEIASNAENTATVSNESVQASEAGLRMSTTCQNSIEKLASEIDSGTNIVSQLDQHSQQINTIVKTIQDIAEQTNLLALNAAIEAARAGEQGRGFAVVADEVRVLSQRTHSSTTEISTMISNLQTASSKATETMQNCHTMAQTSVSDTANASNSFKNLAEAIKSISDLSTQIAAAAEEQTLVTEEINRNTENIRQVSVDFLEGSEVGSTQANTLTNLAQDLVGLLSQFKLR